MLTLIQFFLIIVLYCMLVIYKSIIVKVVTGEMATREEDWLRQAKRDLEHARHALEDRDYECLVLLLSRQR